MTRLLFLVLIILSPPAFAVDVSTSQVDMLPKALTDIKVHTGKFGKPSAGDVIELSVRAPLGEESAAPAQAEKLKDQPIEWGNGRLLWWKPADSNGVISLGLTTYTPGSYEIASIPFIKDGKPVFASQPRTVEVVAIGGDKQKDEIYHPSAVSFPRWIWVALGFVSLVLALAGIWWIKKWTDRRKARVENLARAHRVLNPQEEFEKRRGDIELEKFLESGKFKQHYFALSDSAKSFLGRSFRFDAEERTTRELVRELESLGLSQEIAQKWASLFEEMDITKFTDQTPEYNAALSLSARLSQLVSTTYRVSPVGREAVLNQVQPGVKK